MAERASKAFLRARVRESYRKKQGHLVELGRLSARLEEKLDTVDYEKVTRLSYAAAEKTHAECKRRHVRKLETLLSRSKKKVELRPEGQARWVVNLSKRTLTSSQEEVLQKGLNFAPAPASFRCRILWRRQSGNYRKMTPRTYGCVCMGFSEVLSFPRQHHEVSTDGSEGDDGRGHPAGGQGECDSGDGED